MINWQVVIGLEIHAQLKTKAKIFSNASTDFGSTPNIQANEVDLAMPGVLPVLNKQAVIMAIKFGLAINAVINKENIFARKNYFYPDLPKGYQISQMELPIVGTGQISINIDNTKKNIRITRAHLEEDAGKSIHNLFENYSAIDLNRAGIPLLEIVSEPDISSAKEAVIYAKKIHTLVKCLSICDGNMQEGSFRFDANISIKKPEQQQLGVRTEIKNINSFKFLERAIELEIDRQINILEDGGNIKQETRLYDEIKDETRSMRSKEDANDYRYFPDPDLLPVQISDQLIATIKAELPELPEAKKLRYIEQLSLNKVDSEILANDKDIADYFERMIVIVDAKLALNWIMGELSSYLNANNLSITHSKITPTNLAQLINRITDNTISNNIAKEIFKVMWQDKKDVDTVIKEQGLKQITDTNEISIIIDKIITDNQKQVQQFKDGNHKILGFFIGKVMQKTAGKANPKQVNEILNKKLK